MLIYTVMFIGLNIVFHQLFNMEDLKKRYPKDYIFRLFSMYFVALFISNIISNLITHEDYLFVIACHILLSIGVTTIHFLLEYLNYPLSKLFEKNLYLFKLLLRCTLFILFIYISIRTDYTQLMMIEPIVWMYRFLVILFIGIELDLLIQMLDKEDRFDYFYPKLLERLFILFTVYYQLYPIAILPLLIRVGLLFIPKYENNKLHILMDVLVNGLLLVLGIFILEVGNISMSVFYSS